MTGWLKDLRTHVKETLTANSDEWGTWDYSPERISAPSIATALGSPAVEDGATFGTVQVRLVVTLVVRGAQDNAKVQDDIDGLIETSVIRLLAAGYGIEQVGQPYALDANGARYVAVDVTVTADVEPIETEGD